MRFSRRAMLSGLSGSLVAGTSFPAIARTFNVLSELPPLPGPFKSLSDEDDMNQQFGDELTPQGTAPPSSDEISIANAIIAAAPTNVIPIDVAGFLLDVASGKHGSDWQPYTRAWPIDADANPLILDFFKRTKTAPAGDRTAWCAAFVNWCLFQAHGIPYPAQFTQPTKSAASADFRTWGQTVLRYDATTSTIEASGTPQVGDLVVFQDIDSSGKPDTYHGHVAFFLAIDEKAVKVLGGNQFEGHPVVHAINVKSIPLKGSLQLHSVRTDASLHRI